MAKRNNGRPQKVISPEMCEVILTLIGCGDSDRRVQKIVKIAPKSWKAYAARNKGFAALLEKARERRDGGLARLLRDSMTTMIKKGHPWWAKLAIHNFDVLMKDPDVISAGKLKRLLEKAKTTENADAYVEADPALDSATFPPGATPSTSIDGPIQDRAGGTAERQNGDSQTVAGGVPVAGKSQA